MHRQIIEHIHTMISRFKLLICILYGCLSIFQTLNSRYLFRTIGFNFFSFSFMIQRLVNVAVFSTIGGGKIKKQCLTLMLPYSFIMCTINILSSFCLTLMPLAAFMAFKKFIVIFCLFVGIILKFPNNFNKMQYICLVFIAIGGAMVGQRDILKGESLGYITSLIYTLFQAFALQYQSYMHREKHIEPQDLFLMNSIISLPYYLAILLFQGQFTDIYGYFVQKTTADFLISFCLLLILACVTEFTASYITMKISPFEKATVSNIKDLILTLISVYYFKDFILSPFSQTGIFSCLTASIIFSTTLLQKKLQQNKKIGSHQQIQPQLTGLSIQDRIQRELQNI